MNARLILASECAGRAWDADDTGGVIICALVVVLALGGMWINR